MRQYSILVPYIKQLLVGNVLSRIIPLLALPALSRLYPPSAYGQLAMYLSVFIVVSPLFTLELQQQIALIDNKEGSRSYTRRLLSLSNHTFPLLALLLTLIYLIFFKDNVEISILSFILLSPYINAQGNILHQYLVSQKKFKEISFGKTLGAITNVGVAFLFLAISNSPYGLILGHGLGLGVNMLTFLYYSDLGIGDVLKLSSSEQAKVLIHKNLNYPKYILPKVFVNNILNQIPIYFIQAQFGLQTVGWFSRSKQFLEAPTSTLSNSSGEVFKKEAAIQTAQYGSCKSITKHYLIAHAFLGIIGVVLTTAFAPKVFAWLFGEEWRYAGFLAQYLAPIFAMRLITAPIGALFFIRNRQKELFWVDTILMLTTLSIFLLGLLQNMSLVQCLSAYVLAYCSAYFYGAIRSYQLSK